MGKDEATYFVELDDRTVYLTTDTSKEDLLAAAIELARWCQSYKEAVLKSQ